MSHKSRKKAVNREDETIAKFYYFETFGFEEIPDNKNEQRDEVRKRYVQALCNAVGGGDRYSRTQIKWLKGYFRTKGYSHELVDSVDGLVEEAADKIDIELVMDCAGLINLTPGLKKAGGCIVYDMFRVAAVNNFQEEQMYNISLIATEIEVPAVSINALRKLAEEEHQLRIKRIGLLFPKGHPSLAKEFRC